MPLMFTLVFNLITGLLVAINIQLSVFALLLCIAVLTGWLIGLSIHRSYFDSSDIIGRQLVSSLWQPFLLVLIVFLFGILITTLQIKRGMQSRVVDYEQNIATFAVIEGFPNKTVFGQKTVITTHSGRYQSFWPNDIILRPGETWRINCTYQPVLPVVSPGAFDPAKYSFLNGIDGNCRVTDFKKTTVEVSLINRVRASLYYWIYQQPISIDTQGIMLALMLGDKSGLTPQQKSLLTNSHTSHLLVVSGLHLSLVFLIFFWLSGIPGRVMSIFFNIPARHFQWIAGMVSVGLYAALCGFPVPTQRAMIMLFVPFCFYFSQKAVASDQVYWTAMVVVLLVDPLAIMSFSFWLSFSAVGILLLVLSTGQSAKNPTMTKSLLLWLKPQVVISIALIPFLWLMGLAANPASLFVNLLAIPLVSFLMIPLLILMLASSLLLPDYVWYLAKLFQFFGYLLSVIQQFGQSYQGTLVPGYSGIFMFALLSITLALPNGLPGKKRFQVFLLLSLFCQLLKTTLPEKGLNLYLLDVGQGQSAIVQQGDYRFMVDSGPGLPDSGAFVRVVLPFLDSRLSRNLDAIIYSHNDNDHVSGYLKAPSILNSPIWLFGEPEIDGFNTCAQGQTIHQKGLSVSLLAPFDKPDYSGNRSSCVVKIVSEHGCILLPGDIDKLIEYAIIADENLKYESIKSCEVLVASHHGSASSTSMDWLTLFGPKLFLVSAGKFNRFNHPDPSVIKKITSMNIPWLTTQTRGSIWVQIINGKIQVRELNRSRFYWELPLNLF